MTSANFGLDVIAEQLHAERESYFHGWLTGGFLRNPGCEESYQISIRTCIEIRHRMEVRMYLQSMIEHFPDTDPEHPVDDYVKSVMHAFGMCVVGVEDYIDIALGSPDDFLTSHRHPDSEYLPRPDIQEDFDEGHSVEDLEKLQQYLDMVERYAHAMVDISNKFRSENAFGKWRRGQQWPSYYSEEQVLYFAETMVPQLLERISFLQNCRDYSMGVCWEEI